MTVEATQSQMHIKQKQTNKKEANRNKTKKERKTDRDAQFNSREDGLL